MPRYSEKQKVALEALMKNDVHRHAVAILESEGHQGLTLERLAKDIGVARGTLYNYFKDRDAIVEFVEERVFTPVVEGLEEISKSDLPPLQKLETFITQTFTKEFELGKVLIAVSRAHRKGRRRLTGEEAQEEGRSGRFVIALRSIVQEGIDSGDFLNLPAELVADIVLGAMRGLTVQMVSAGEMQKPEEILPTFLTIIFGGLTGNSYPR